MKQRSVPRNAETDRYSYSYSLLDRRLMKQRSVYQYAQPAGGLPASINLLCEMVKLCFRMCCAGVLLLLGGVIIPSFDVVISSD